MRTDHVERAKEVLDDLRINSNAYVDIINKILDELITTKNRLEKQISSINDLKAHVIGTSSDYEGTAVELDEKTEKLLHLQLNESFDENNNFDLDTPDT